MNLASRLRALALTIGGVAVLAVGALAAPVLSSHTAVRATGSCQTSRSSLAPDPAEADLISRINGYRAQAGVGPLVVSQPLMAAAAWKSADLGANAYFAHDDLSRSWTQRIRDCGYSDTPSVAENLAAGNEDAASTFEQWRTSSGHNANMLSAGMTAVGVARAYTAGSPYGWYWTADFGADAPGVPAAPAAATARPATPASASTPDGSAAAGTVSLNATVVVAGTGDCLRIHAAPAVAAPVQSCLPDGSMMVVIAGPVTADGFSWWQLGALGWAVDRYLLPLQPASGR
ncbi:MAG: CAP domain-containing protein [Dehalococcoidia bacterium]